ncbi:MAG: tetratricopeptide repeat protein, partial [Planctomycetota bacterium]
MATRINTKFVITLTSIIVLLALGMVGAFMVLKKSAADHVRLAEEALGRADVALVDNDIELHNSEIERAAKHYGNAKVKEPTNVAHLYGYIDAQKQIICDNQTLSGNTLQSILAAASTIHDTPGASTEDRAFLYELLHEWIRMGLAANRQSPIGSILGFTEKRLDVDPEDPVAMKYRSIGVSFLAEQRTDQEEIEQDLTLINKAIQNNPKTAWLQTAMARYQLGNARRIFRANGNTESPEVVEGVALALEHTAKALALAADSPSDYLEAAGILFELRISDEVTRESILAKQTESAKALDEMLQDNNNRDGLFIEELGRAAAILLRANVPAEGGDPGFNGPEVSQAIIEQLTKDRPDEPAAYQIMGNRQRELGRLDEASKTLDAGLKIDRLTTARDFVRDELAVLQMRSTLAEVKCLQALQAVDAEQRETLLKQAKGLIDQMAKADTPQPQQTEWRDARVNFLLGRVYLASGQPAQAVKKLDAANQAYGNRDAATLRLLAQTHAQLGLSSRVPDFYEAIISGNLRPQAEDFLNLINIYLAPGQSQQLDKAEAQLNRYQEAMPNDIRAVRLRARLLAERGKIDEAIAMLQEQDLEEHTELFELIQNYKALSGDTAGVIDILRERLADRKEGEELNLQLAVRLVNLLPDAESKNAEIDRLVNQGLDAKVAEVLKRVLTSGQATLDDQLALIDVRVKDPAQNALQKFLIYQRSNDLEGGRSYLESAVELDPNNPSVIEWRYRLALNDQAYDAAEQAIADMLKLPITERSGIAVADGRFMRAQLQAVQANALEPGEARNKAFRQAIVSYNNALDEYSYFIEGWVQLGRLHLSQNNFFAAQDSLQEALKLQAQNAVALDLLARAEIGSGDQINAMERYQQILAIQPNNAAALNQFTALAQQVGQLPRAIALREQIRTRVPNNFDNRRRLAALYALNENYNRAKTTLKEVIETEGNSRQNVATLAQIQSLADEQDQAVQTVKDYLAELGDDAAWQDYLLLAQSEESAEKAADANTSFAKAIELEKADGTLFAELALAQARLARGEIEVAAAQFEELIKQYPDNDSLKQQAAELYLRLQNFEKAEQYANQMPKSADQLRMLIQTASAQQDKLGIAIQRAREGVKAYPS